MLILQSSAWREYRGRPPPGQNLTTHMAMIQAPSGQLHRCYVKMAPPTWPTPLTESVSWLLAEALDLPRPKFAALVFVPIPRLRAAKMPLDQHWHTVPEALAFCSEAVEGRGLAHRWKWITRMREKRLFKAEEVRRISAFDEWADNQDRHTGNMIQRADGVHVPIDNEFTLYSLLWQGVMNAMQQSIVRQSLLQRGQVHYTGADQQRFQVDIANAAKRHAQALRVAAPRIAGTISRLVPPPNAAAVEKAIMDFLTPRSDEAWLAAQLGVIV